MTSEKKVRWLKQVSILSLLLNIVFFCLFYIVAFGKDFYRRDSSSKPLIAKSKTCLQFPEDFLETLAQSSLADTVALFQDEQLFYGYPLRLWALSVAMHKYHVDISPVLSHPLTFIELKEQDRRWLLPELSPEEFQSVRHFLSIEKYPFTSLGLFLLLAQGYERGAVDEGCFYSFCRTPEFLYFRVLLGGADVRVSSLEAVVGMIMRGGHELFFTLCNDQTRVTKISDEDRRHLLWAYLQRGEALAAELLLVHDEDWVLHEMDDERLREFVAILPQESVSRYSLITRLSRSPRRNVIDGYEDQQEPPGEVPVVREESPMPTYVEYSVAKGDSLWVLARRFQVSIGEIMDENQLTHDRLHLGQKLRIPVKRGD